MLLWAIGSALAAAPGALDGTWVFSGGDPEIAQRDQMIEDTAQTFNFAFRGFARGKLNKIAALDSEVAITGDDETVTIEFDGANPRKSHGRSDGIGVPIRGASVRFDLEPSKTLVITGETKDGGKESIYTLTGPDTMKVTHKVWSGLLNEPMVWSLSYRRR